LSDRFYQNLLEKLLLQVIRELKKKMFPGKRTKLLYGPIDIDLRKMEGSTVGLYENEETKKFIYKHHIFVSENSVNNYIISRSFKKYYKRRIKDIIAHELIHAYVFEKYEGVFDLKNIHLDGSPIFLGVLAYLDLPNGHKSWRSFKHTDLYKRIKKCKSYEEVENILLQTMSDYKKKFRELEHIIDNDKKLIYINGYEFGSGITTGLNGSSTSTFYANGYLCKANFFHIGANANIEKLHELTMKKIYNNSFNYKYYGLYECVTIKDKKDKLHLQSMNI
jgi:hypothetical protein